MYKSTCNFGLFRFQQILNGRHFDHMESLSHDEFIRGSTPLWGGEKQIYFIMLPARSARGCLPLLLGWEESNLFSRELQ